MIISEGGYGVQPSNWHVDEDKAAGFSRVYYITGGIVYYRDEYQSRILQPYNMYVFPSYSPFHISHEPSNPLCCMWFHLDLFPSIITRLIEFSPKSDMTLGYVLSALMNEHQNKHTDTAFFLKLTQALAEYILMYGDISKPDMEFSEILHHIRNTFVSCECTVENISRKFNYTPEHFIRLFHKNMNITPYQYIQNLRMTEAARLLLTGKSVGSIAKSVGYSESKIFSRAFTRKYGVAPSHYKDYYYPIA